MDSYSWSPGSFKLGHATSGQDWPHPVNVEKIVVVPDTTQSDISPLATVEHVDSSQESVTPVHPASPNKDLADVAFRLGMFLECKPSKSAVASEASKFPPSR